VRLLHLALVALTVATSVIAFAADDQTNFEKILPGQALVVPAPLGVMTDVLGLGFDDHLDDLDAAGKRHRAFDPKFTRVLVNQYTAQFAQLDNEFKLQAHAQVLGTQLGVGFSNSKRYMVLRVRQLREVASLKPTGDPLGAEQVMASKAYFSWPRTGQTSP
jgi:hypothetical protein